LIRSRLQRLQRHIASLVLALLAAAPVSAQTLSGAESPRLTYKFGLNYFVQSSIRENLPFNDDQFKDDESFLWERLRPKLTVRNQHVTVLLEGQDTHSVGNQLVVRKAWLDLLNAYVDVKRGGGWSFRIGRRQGDFDTITRLIRTPDFAAVVRSFDVAEVGWQRRRPTCVGLRLPYR
jgi:hypothetical protein